MKVFLLAPNENWICDRITKEWQNYMPQTVTANIHEADVIWLLAGWCWNQIPTSILQKKKVLVTEHHIVPEKFDSRRLRNFVERDQFADAYHVPNDKTASFISQLTNKPIHVVEYWYDPQLWFSENKEECRKLLGIPNDKFIIGSFQRDSEGGTRLPKLEKGPDLFVDYLQKLDRDNLYVLLGGWRREYLVDRLDAIQIPYKRIELAPITMVRKMYNCCDLYVVSSRYEGGPQALYEASIMKVPIISRDVGVASRILCANCIVDIPNEIYYPSRADVEANFKKVQKYNIENHKELYHEMLENILK